MAEDVFGDDYTTQKAQGILVMSSIVGPDENDLVQTVKIDSSCQIKLIKNHNPQSFSLDAGSRQRVLQLNT